MAVAAIFISLSVIAQKLDSLRKAYQKRSGDTTSILLTAEFAYQLYSLRPDSSLLLAKEAEQQAIAMNFKKGEGRAKRVIGIYYWTKGDFDKAMQYFEKALDISERANDQKGIAGCLTNMGVVYRNKGNVSLASDFFFKSLKIREAIGDKQGMATTSNNLGLVYTTQKMYEKALENFNYSIKVAGEIGDKPGVARAYLNRGRVYQTLTRYAEAIDSYNQSLIMARAIGDQRGISMACENLASVYILTKQFEKVKPFLNEGLEMAQALQSKDRIADLKEEYANLYNSIGEPQKALQEASEAAALAREVGVLEVWKDALLQKSIAERKLGLHREALADYTQYIKLRDSVRNEEITRATLSKEYDFKSQKFRVEQEKKEIEHVVAAEKQKRIINTFAGIAFTLLVISLMIFISNRKINRQKKELQSARRLIEQQNREISKRNETLAEDVNKRTHELAEYNKQLEQFAFVAAHNLRGPVARILGLGNLLAVAAGNEAEKKLVIEMLISTTHELDEVVRDINVILQAQRDLTSAISPLNISDEFYKIKSILHREIEEVKPTIEEDFSKVSVFNTVGAYFQSIFLNLLSNAIKYRDPGRDLKIKITSEIIDDYVVITCTDNGLGINLSKFGDKIFSLYSRFHFHVTGKGIGLYLVKSQLNSIGGKIEVESKEGIGSTFKVYLKMNELS